MKRFRLVLLSAICILMASQAPAQVELPQPTFGTIAVRLQPDGLLRGTIGYIDPSSLELVPIDGVSVDFVQNGRAVAQTVSAANGQLTVRGLSPQAVYSVFARAEFDGRRWFLAHGVSVLAAEVEEPSAALSPRPAYRLTAARARRMNLNLEKMAYPTIGLAMCPEGDFGGFGDHAGVLGGDFAHFKGGGGGGGGGLGGGGLAAAAVAAAVAVSASDRDRIRIATPFRP